MINTGYSMKNTHVIPKGKSCMYKDDYGILKACYFWETDKDSMLVEYQKRGILSVDYLNEIQNDDREIYPDSGYCNYLERGDWMEIGTGEIWKMNKECEINL